MPQPNDPMAGVFRLGQNLTLADIWTGLHGDAQLWQRAAFAPDTTRQRAGIADNTRALLVTLRDCPAARWQALIEAQGVTQVGGIALSWCQGADLKMVAAAVLKDVKDPDQIDARAMGLLCPDLRPDTRSLMAIAEAVQYDIKSLVVVTLSDPAPIIMDASPVWLSDLPAILGTVLLKRYDPGVSRLSPTILENWRSAA